MLAVFVYSCTLFSVFKYSHLTVLLRFRTICSMDYYLQKTYYKTASLISNSCKAVAILAGHTADVSMLAYEYGRNLVCETSYSFLPIFEARFLS